MRPKLIQLELIDLLSSNLIEKYFKSKSAKTLFLKFDIAQQFTNIQFEFKKQAQKSNFGQIRLELADFYMSLAGSEQHINRLNSKQC